LTNITVTEEELEKLIVKGGEIMNQAVEAYCGITATEEFKHLEIIRARTRHDEAQALSNARKQRDVHWQGVVAEKDTIIADKDTMLADKDTMLADKDALIAKLQARLDNQQ